MKQSLNIYFCGSIRGSQANLEIYQNIVTHLKKYGKVLTEHIAFKNIIEPANDEEIFQNDLAKLKLSDVMIAEISNPSHGVGMELGIALTIKDEKYPILCLKQKQSEFKTSAMINGCDKFNIKEYDLIETAIKDIDEFLKKHFQS